MLIPFGILSAAGVSAAPTGAYELISTTILGSNAASVTFSSLGTYSSTYKHLQIRFTGKVSKVEAGQELALRVNGISTNSYSWHYMRGNGSTVIGDNGTTTNGMFLGQFTADNATASSYGGGVIDLLDPYSTSKNKTFRGLSGVPTGGMTRINLYAGLFQSTNAVDSISIFSQNFSDNMIAGSRFSLYGIRG
jgi:hypothetical protein